MRPPPNHSACSRGRPWVVRKLTGFSTQSMPTRESVRRFQQLQDPVRGPRAWRRAKPVGARSGGRRLRRAYCAHRARALDLPIGMSHCATGSDCWCSKGCCCVASGSTGATAPSCSARATCCARGRARTPNATLSQTTGWRVLEPTRVAVLDVEAARCLSAYPEVTGRLVGRALERARNLAINMAIVHQARVNVRLRMLLWHLADRWGRVRSEGVVLPLRLTHAVLADLVAARRPTVTTALTQLARQGAVQAVGRRLAAVRRTARGAARAPRPSRSHGAVRERPRLAGAARMP